MYRVTTGEARTDLYKSDPFDMGIAERGLAQVRDEKFAHQQLKSKQEQEREDDIMTNLSAMGKVAIMPKDRELIAGKSQAVRDFVVENIDGLKKGDANLMMQYQNLAGDLSTSAEQSKNFREIWEQRGAAIAKEPDAYDQDVLDAHLGRASSADAGNWNDDPSIYHKNINYLDRVTGDLSQFAQRQAKDTPYGKTYDLASAEELIASDLEDPQLFRQASKDFAKANDKLGAKTEVEYYQKKYAPKLVIKDTKAGPQGDGSGSSSKEPKIRTNYAKTNENSGILNWEYVSPPDNPYITSSIGDVRPGIIHDNGDKTYMEVTTKPDSEGNYEKKILGPEETRDFVRLKLGSSLNELRQGRAPKHISHTATGISSAEAGHIAAEKTRAGKGKTYTAKMADGSIITSTDGKNWVDKKGNPVK